MTGHLSKRPNRSRSARAKDQGCLAVDQVRPEPAAGQIIPIEILRPPASGKADLEAAALRDDFVLDQAASDMPHHPASVNDREDANLGAVAVPPAWGTVLTAADPHVSGKCAPRRLTRHARRLR
jgi:hypothetical protein